MREVRVTRRRRPAVRSILAAAVILLAGWSAWRARAVGRDRQALAEARAEMQAGRHGHAAHRLGEVRSAGALGDEAALLLGDCEKARGHAREAVAAWARVPAASPFGTRALQRQAAMLIQQGRLGEAERLIERVLADPRIDAGALRILLGMTYSLQGRIDDGERLIARYWRRLDEAGQGATERAIQLARLYGTLRGEAASADATRAYLDRAGRLAPDDDRVWLGRAIAATRAGAFDEAARWLDACQGRRPEDPAVWRARLEWALAFGREPEALRAMERLPASEVTEAGVHRLSAWLIRQRQVKSGNRKKCLVSQGFRSHKISWIPGRENTMQVLTEVRLA